jgi:hypothetical protein
MPQFDCPPGIVIPDAVTSLALHPHRLRPFPSCISVSSPLCPSSPSSVCCPSPSASGSFAITFSNWLHSASTELNSLPTCQSILSLSSPKYLLTHSNNPLHRPIQLINIRQHMLEALSSRQHFASSSPSPFLITYDANFLQQHLALLLEESLLCRLRSRRRRGWRTCCAR